MCSCACNILCMQYKLSSLDSLSYKEGAEAPASGRSLAGAWPEPVEKTTKRVLAGAGNGWSQLAGAIMINFTQDGTEAPASCESLAGACRSWRKKYKKGLLLWPVAPAKLWPLAGASAPFCLTS